MNPFESTAHAAGAGGGFPIDILLLVGFVLIFYFLLWRPQSKRRKEHEALIGGLSKGDEVVAGGGIGGVTFAAAARRAGLRVTLVERRRGVAHLGEQMPEPAHCDQRVRVLAAEQPAVALHRLLEEGQRPLEL